MKQKVKSRDISKLSIYEKEKYYRETVNTMCMVLLPKMGEGKMIEHMWKHWDIIRWGIYNATTEDSKKNSLLIMCILPYISDGNQHMVGFTEWYTYISKFKGLYEGTENRLLFRTMTDNEFVKLKLEGNQSPSWSPMFTILERFAGTQIMTDSTDLCYAIVGVFKPEDIIFEDCGTEVLKGIDGGSGDTFTDECECFVRMGAKPIVCDVMYKFDIEWFESRFNLNIDDVTVSNLDIKNGYIFGNIINSFGYKFEEGERYVSKDYTIKVFSSIERLTKEYPEIKDLKIKVISKLGEGDELDENKFTTFNELYEVTI